MKLPTYKQALQMGKEKINELLAPAKAARARKQGELELCKLDERVATVQTEIQEMCTREEIDFEALIDKLDDLELIERRKKQYSDILTQMFPEE